MWLNFDRQNRDQVYSSFISPNKSHQYQTKKGLLVFSNKHHYQHSDVHVTMLITGGLKAYQNGNTSASYI